MTPPNPTHLAAATKAANTKEPRKLTNALMKRVEKLLEKTGTTQTDLARHLGKRPNEVSEWIRGWRSAPSGEMTLRIQKWCDDQDKKLAKAKS